MKKVLAISLALTLAFPAAGLMAQQQQAPAKVQPVQTAYYQVPETFMGLSMGAAVAVAVAIAVAVAAANDSDDNPVATSAAASGTR